VRTAAGLAAGLTRAEALAALARCGETSGPMGALDDDAGFGAATAAICAAMRQALESELASAAAPRSQVRRAQSESAN
jgi:hypothetical protein